MSVLINMKGFFYYYSSAKSLNIYNSHFSEMCYEGIIL